MRSVISYYLTSIAVVLLITSMQVQAGPSGYVAFMRSVEDTVDRFKQTSAMRGTVSQENEVQNNKITVKKDHMLIPTQGAMPDTFGSFFANSFRKIIHGNKSKPIKRPKARRVAPAFIKTKRKIVRRKKRRARLRTVCVRLCDGYYWPMNFNSSGKKLYRDNRVCKNSCAAPARMYYLDNRSTETGRMRDLRGNLYKHMKNAYLYRKKYVSSCKCKPDPWTAEAQAYYAKRIEKAKKSRGKRQKVFHQASTKRQVRTYKKQRISRR